MGSRTEVAGLHVSTDLFTFIEQQVLKGLPISSDHFWQGFADIVNKLSPENEQLLQVREDLQQQITQWHQQNPILDAAQYKTFLQDIGYLVPDVDDFTISTSNVDQEIATMAGPQLVVPITNARFALNAVNARWGSLYDALYGSDIISEEGGAENSGGYNPVRGEKVIAMARDFLDLALALETGTHHQVTQYCIEDNSLQIHLENGDVTSLAAPAQWLGYQGEKETPTCLLFSHNGLRFEINFDATSKVASQDKAGISDITMESALTTIMDCEDSVATVDAEDKLNAYQNWLGLVQGTLSTEVSKQGKSFTRAMAEDRQYLSARDQEITLAGRSLMFIRNVGHLMTNDAILTADNKPIYEGIMDAVITSTIALYDIHQLNNKANSREKSIYIVKPKMHGPDEVAFTNKLFEQVEALLNLAPNTIKMGIMDEERRTTVNLKACIYQAKSRVVFINTGFLDRTGDEIHTSMAAGAMARKGDIKSTKWLAAYEDNNVDVGLACGFNKKAQIGKGMWPIPDNMAQMLAAKLAHVESGANTAWVPSPTAATIHAMHYHQEDVFSGRQQISQRTPARLDDILTIPLANDTNWSEQEVNDEIDNNVQGILGYVVRWIDQGIGCSKVPDITNTGLMEDRATLRISSQHLANWLKHGICSEQQVKKSLVKMAKIVDQQNADDPAYHAMSDNFDNNIAIKAASDLIFNGEQQPNGYTEPVLHYYRKIYKQN